MQQEQCTNLWSAKLRAVVADDSRLMRQRVAAWLDDTGHFQLIGMAIDAPSAIDAVQRLGPELVVLDIRMPGNGIHALEEIKKVATPPVVIMFSAFATPHYRTRCLEAGADYVFDKAQEQEQFLDTLEQLAAMLDPEGKDEILAPIARTT